MDVICQAKSGMGKTAVFVLSTLQQIEPVAGQVAALVLCHTRELAYQVWVSIWTSESYTLYILRTWSCSPWYICQWPSWLVSYILIIWVGCLSLLQICHEFERFSTYLPDIKVAVFYGGVNIKIHKDLLKNECPHIVVGTPGRVLALARDKELALRNVRHFILDECDKMLESLGMHGFYVTLNLLQLLMQWS